MIRSSRLNLMTMIVRAGASGYYTRGYEPVFRWLRKYGLAEYVDTRMLTHRLTDKGRAFLREQGICDKCGGHGTYRGPDYVKPWVDCDHPNVQFFGAPISVEQARSELAKMGPEEDE